MCVWLLEGPGRQGPEPAGAAWMERSGCSPFPMCWAKGTQTFIYIYVFLSHRLLIQCFTTCGSVGLVLFFPIKKQSWETQYFYSDGVLVMQNSQRIFFLLTAAMPS